MLDDIANAATDSVTETSEAGMGTNLVNSLVGVLVGIVLFFGSFVVLWWNEGNVIAEKDALEEMRKVLVKGNATSPVAAHNNKLIHATARLESKEKLADEPYLKAGAYLQLDRKVEMYQWVEKSETKTEKSVGGKKTTKTTYSYAMGWAEGQIDSSRFKNPTGHSNPALTVAPKKLAVNKSSFGKFDGKEVLDKVWLKQDLPVTAATVGGTPKDKNKPSLSNGMLFIRKKPGATTDAIGDVRISYKVVKQGPFSVIAKQTGKRLAPYMSKNGKEKFIVEAGKKPPSAMIEAEKAAAGTMAMVFRVIGFFLMWIGMNLCAGPITTLLDVIPFLGSAGRIVLGIVFFVVSLVLSLVTIGLSMIAHNPIALVLFLAAGAGLGYYLYQRKKQPKAASGAPGMAAGGAPAGSAHPTRSQQSKLTGAA